jgi:hypothetical protein
VRSEISDNRGVMNSGSEEESAAEGEEAEAEDAAGGWGRISGIKGEEAEAEVK